MPTFFIRKYMKTKYHNVPIKRCGTGSKLAIFGVVLQGQCLLQKKSNFDTTLLFFHSRKGKTYIYLINI